MITFTYQGDFSKTKRFLKKIGMFDPTAILEDYAQRGVSALSAATPVDTGKTAASWSYTVEQNDNGYSIIWHNSNVNPQKNINIAVILQYGHGTRNGGYVVGRDYINPALQPLFDQMANTLWKELGH